MAEHLDLDAGGLRPEVLLQVSPHGADLGQGTFAGENEAADPEGLVKQRQAFGIGHRHLGGEEYGKPVRGCGLDHCHIPADDRIDPGFRCGFYDTVNLGDLVFMNDRVEGKVGAGTGLMALRGNPIHLRWEKVAVIGAHVEPADSEIDGVCPGFEGGSKTGPVSSRSHQLGFCGKGGSRHWRK